MEGLALLEVAAFDYVEHTMFSRRYFSPHACFKISVQLLVHKLEIRNCGGFDFGALSNHQHGIDIQQYLPIVKKVVSCL